MSDPLPLVSIIIPVYNHEKYVEEALNSILHQTYSHLEVIIIDDGSKDRSTHCVDEWLLKTQQMKNAGHHFTFIKQENRGAHATINRGLSIAQGDFLTILNSDDIYDIHRIEKLIKRLDEEQAELVFSAAKGIDDYGNSLPIDHPWRETYESWKDSLSEAPTVGFQLLLGNLAISTGNLLFSRNLYQRVGEFKNLKFAHDHDFLMRALLITEPVFLNEELYFYRIHGNNTITQPHDLIRAELNEIYREYLFQVSRNPPANLKAPCHWYWPSVFSFTRLKSEIDNGLTLYLTKPTSSKNLKSNDEKNPHLASLKLKERRKKKKISLITHELTLSGAPKVIADLAIALKEQGYKVNVISLLEGPMRKELESRGIPLYVMPQKIALGVLYNPHSFIRKCYRLLASFILPFKVHKTIIGNTYITGPFLRLLSIFNPFYRLIWYIHESSPPSALLKKVELNRETSFLNTARYKARFELWFGSKNTQEIWQKAGFGGKTVYWSGVPHCHFSNQTLDKPITEILSIGSCSARKGTHYLIEAFIIGVKEGYIPDDIRLTVIGFYDDMNILHGNALKVYIGDLILQVAHSGLKDRIQLITHVEPQELDAYYQKADLYVQSSIQECLPLALFKAMSMELPIITTNVNGCTEVIEHDKTGYVCHPRNSRLLLKAIVNAIKNPEKSRALGMEAKKAFNEKFCLEKNLEEAFHLLNPSDVIQSK